MSKYREQTKVGFVSPMHSLDYLTKHEKNVVYRLKLVLQDWFGNDVVMVMIFGTRIKKTGTAGDDIDVLIVLKNVNQMKLNRINMIAMDINLEDSVMFSPVVYDEDEFNDPVNRETPFLRKILEEGVVVK